MKPNKHKKQVLSEGTASSVEPSDNLKIEREQSKEVKKPRRVSPGVYQSRTSNDILWIM
jgi:hypothetical protein